MWRYYWRRYRERKIALFGLLLFLSLLLGTVMGPYLIERDPTAVDISNRLSPPNKNHLLGTDPLGRDNLSRIIWGARISMSVGLVTVIIGLIVGTFIGLVSGFYRGWLDKILMRFMDAFLTFPPMLLAIALMAGFGISVRNIMIALGIVYTPRFARLIRGSTLSVVERDYVTAATAMGARGMRILFGHLLPNVIAPIFVQASYSFGRAIIAEAGLSFLGVGVRPPNPSWGLMLSDARGYLQQAPWYPIFPGVAIMLTVLAINLIGDGLRDAFDPKLKV